MPLSVLALTQAPLALFPHTSGPYLALVLIGFAVGIFGHLIGARALVLAGILLVLLGALFFPFLAHPPPSP